MEIETKELVFAAYLKSLNYMMTDHRIDGRCLYWKFDIKKETPEELLKEFYSGGKVPAYQYSNDIHQLRSMTYGICR